LASPLAMWSKEKKSSYARLTAPDTAGAAVRAHCRKRREVRSSYARLVAPLTESTTVRSPLQEERSDHSWRGVGQDWQLQSQSRLSAGKVFVCWSRSGQD